MEELAEKNPHSQPLLHPLIVFDEIQGISSQNKIKIIQLITSDKEIIHRQNETGETPLAYLMKNYYRRPQWIEESLFLISYGADPNTRHKEGNTLLHTLVYIRGKNSWRMSEYSKNCITTLVKVYNADINIENTAQQTPLQFLLNKKRGVIKDILHLVALGADPDTKDADDNSLLHILIDVSRYSGPGFEKGRIPGFNKEAIITLITLYRANIHIQNRLHRTLLESFLDQTNFTGVDALFLVECGANPNSKNSNGESLLFLLTKNESTFSSSMTSAHDSDKRDIILELLLKHDTEIDEKTLLDVGRRHMIAKKLHQTWLDPGVEEKDKDKISLLLYRSTADSKNLIKEKEDVPKEKAKSINDFFGIMSILSRDEESSNVDITLDYYFNALLVVKNRSRDTILQYVDEMVNLATLNPPLFLVLLEDELKFLKKKDLDGISQRVPFLKALIFDPKIRTISYFEKYLSVINMALEAVGQSKIQLIYRSTQESSIKEAAKEMEDMRLALKQEEFTQEPATFLSQISALPTSISSHLRIPSLPSPSQWLNIGNRGQQNTANLVDEKEEPEIEDKRHSYASG